MVKKSSIGYSSDSGALHVFKFMMGLKIYDSYKHFYDNNAEKIFKIDLFTNLNRSIFNRMDLNV